MYPLNLLLHYLETRAKDTTISMPYTPVFILGAPRSGSTLLYQILLKAFRFAYFSNLHSTFWGGVSVVEHLAHASERDRHETYTSAYGDTSGLFAPSECPHFWYRFFRQDPPHVSLDEVAPKDMQGLRRVLASLMSKAGRPLLIKNLYCCLRLGPIIHYIPEAVFIIIERDIIDNAHSILEARKKRFGNYDSWFSVKPPGYKKLSAFPPHQQVVEQIRAIHRGINDELKNFPDNRIIRIDYESLCTNPEETIDQIKKFFSQSGVDADTQSISIRPFTLKHKMNIDTDIYEALCHYVNSVT